MEKIEQRQKSQVDLPALHREKNCAACKHYEIKFIWEFCGLNETITNGVICHGFYERPDTQPAVNPQL